MYLSSSFICLETHSHTHTRTSCDIASVIPDADHEHVWPLPVATDRELREHGTNLAVLTGTPNPEFAGLIIWRVDHELLSRRIVCCLCLCSTQHPV